MRATSNRKLAEALGVSETAVRKALAAGRISRDPKGGFDIAKVKRQWASNTDAAQQRPQTKATLRPVPAAALESVRETLEESGDPGGAQPLPGGPSFLQARTANELLKAQERAFLELPWSECRPLARIQLLGMWTLPRPAVTARAGPGHPGVHRPRD